jgi:hypothetical protein
MSTPAHGPPVNPFSLPGAKDDLGQATLVGAWTFASLATIFFSLRIYAKVANRKGLWWDDYMLAISWVSYTQLSSISG